MSINSQIEREESYLEEQYNNGEITLSEFNYEMREIRREHKAYAEEQAERAYNYVMVGYYD